MNDNNMNDNNMNDNNMNDNNMKESLLFTCQQILNSFYKINGDKNLNAGRKTKAFLNIIASYFTMLHDMTENNEIDQWLNDCFDMIAKNITSGGNMNDTDKFAELFNEPLKKDATYNNLMIGTIATTIMELCNPLTYYPEKTQKN